MFPALPRARSRPLPGAIAALLLAIGLLLSGCSRGEDEPSTSDILAEIEGRKLTAAEVAEREQIAAVLCRLDDAVLLEVWDRLSARQLRFQDFVFGRACTAKATLYGEATGRFAPATD